MLRESAGLGTPWLNRPVLPNGFRRIDALKANSRAGFEQQRVAVNDAPHPVHAFIQTLRRPGFINCREDSPNNKGDYRKPKSQSARFVPIAALCMNDRGRVLGFSNHLYRNDSRQESIVIVCRKAYGCRNAV